MRQRTVDTTHWARTIVRSVAKLLTIVTLHKGVLLPQGTHVGAYLQTQRIVHNGLVIFLCKTDVGNGCSRRCNIQEQVQPIAGGVLEKAVLTSNVLDQLFLAHFGTSFRYERGESTFNQFGSEGRLQIR